MFILRKVGYIISCPGMKAFRVVHPFQEAPFLEEEIACPQGESQQGHLMAEILGAFPVEELAYLWRLSELVSLTRLSKSNTNQVGSWAFQEAVGNLVEDLVEAVACL